MNAPANVAGSPLAAMPSGLLAEAVAIYERGDFALALARFGELAAEGDIDALVWQASMYANGEGVAAALPQAFLFYRQAAEWGHRQAQTNVGAMLVMGQGVAADPAAGARWLAKAAEQGDAFALFNLAYLYGKGLGVAQDEVKAAALYRRAAEIGHYPSQARLGFLYANGIGVEKDRVEAFLWLSLAGQHGIGNALNALEAIIAQMSAEEKRKGLALVDRWRSRTAPTSQFACITPIPG